MNDNNRWEVTPSLLTWLRKKKLETGYSQAELGRRGIITQPAWSELLGGRTETITKDTIDSICAAFDIEPEALEEIRVKEVSIDESFDLTEEANDAVNLYRWLAMEPDLLIEIHNRDYKGRLPKPRTKI